MDRVVFQDKDFLVKFLYKLLENPTQIKVQKTLYLLFAYYGATYGNIKKEEDNEFSKQDYPKNLFEASFEAWRYGPVESEIYSKEKTEIYSRDNLSDQEIENFFNSPERKNIKEFIENIVRQTNSIDDFSLVDRTHQDEAWLKVYKEGEKHIKMDNNTIINEYISRYV